LAKENAETPCVSRNFGVFYVSVFAFWCRIFTAFL